MGSVLLLNTSYEPLRVISWKRAVTLFFMGKVEVVEEYDHHIRSVSLVINAPAVVRLLNYVSFRKKSPPLTRTNLLARDNFECQYCCRRLSSAEATVDHVLPRSQGGGTSWENVVIACGPCNRKKGGRTPQQARMKLQQAPERPGWLPVMTFRADGKIPEPWKYFIEIYSVD